MLVAVEKKANIFLTKLGGKLWVSFFFSWKINISLHDKKKLKPATKRLA